MLNKNLLAGAGAVAVGCALAAIPAGPALSLGLDLSGVTLATPDFTDRPFVDGTFSTEFDGTLISGTPGGQLDGDAAGNLIIGGPSQSMYEYRLDFDDLLDLEITGPEGGPFGIFGPFDSWVLTSDADFIVEDNGVADLDNVVNGAGTVSFTGIGGGDMDWSISTDGPVSFLDIKFTNTAGGGNRSTLNIHAKGTPEPATSALALLALGGLGVAMRRRRA